jgi:4-hydroxy-4-methyl-2-oxoglutarate aldolase
MTGPMNGLGIAKRNIVRADEAAVEQLSRFDVATIREAMGRVGPMHPYMRPIYAAAQACGTAITALLRPGDVAIAGLDTCKMREPLATAGLRYVE